MALNGVLRPGYVQLRVLDMDAAMKHYVDRIGLDVVSRESDGRVYLRAFDEFDRHSIVLREDDGAGMDVVGFKVADEDTVDHYRKRLEAAGVKVDNVGEGEQPGVGRRIGFTIPAGHRVELFSSMEGSPNQPMTRNPDVWHVEPRGMRATRFDHILLYGPNIPEVAKFFTTLLDFSLAEAVKDGETEIAAFLSCSNKAHDIAFVSYPEPGKFHHAAFNLDSWNDVGHAADIISRHNISLDIGPTRHGITRGQTIYFFDPSGNRNEVFTGGYFYYPDHPTRVWDADQLGKAIFYYQKELNDRFLNVVT
jgi:catechol 2,3-dioxygenase